MPYRHSRGSELWRQRFVSTTFATRRFKLGMESWARGLTMPKRFLSHQKNDPVRPRGEYWRVLPHIPPP